jgi:YVTN family beta-propeller protein
MARTDRRESRWRGTGNADEFVEDVLSLTRAVALLLCVLGVAFTEAGASARSSASGADPAPPLAFAPVRLKPVSARLVARCRAIQAQARRPLLCPTVLPGATAGGIPGLPPRGVAVTAIGDFFRRRIAGVDIGYGAPWEGAGWTAHRWRNRPCCFLHFDVFRRAPGSRAIPPGARPATLGGRRGLLISAHEGEFYGNGLYWANHVRFLFHAYGTNWVATLHTFGEAATERLLGRLVATLRPVDSIQTRPQRGTPVGVTPSAIISSGGDLWVASLGDLSGNFSGTVYRIDSSSGRITARAHPAGGGGPHALAFSDRAVWVVTYSGVARLDPRSGERVAYLNVGRFPKSIASAAGLLWVVNATPFGKNGSVVSIDPGTNRLAGRPIPLGRSPGALAAGAGSLWAADELEGMLVHIDPKRRRVLARIKVGRMPTAVAVGAGAVWVANSGDGTVSRIDPATNRVTKTIWVGVAPRALAADAAGVWVVSTGSGVLSRIDPATGKAAIVRRRLGDPLAVALEDRDAWITKNDGELLRVPLR